MSREYYNSRPPAWVEEWLDLHTDALHDELREQCAECQRMIRENGRMPPKSWMVKAYENMKRPKRKGIIPAALRRQVFERDGYRCRQCGATDNLAADHVYPEVWGGATTLDNLQTLCRPCNSRKSDKRER